MTITALRVETAAPALIEYRYANSILWGDTYNEAEGMHHIFAASDAEAFEAANRFDKREVGIGFLQRRDDFGRWTNLAELASVPNEAFHYSRPDEVAECWEGVLAVPGLYEALWGFVASYSGPTPEESEEPIHGSNSLAGFWDRLSVDHRAALNDLAAKQPRYGVEEDRVIFRRPPFLDRSGIEREVERLLMILDFLDGDADLSLNGDEEDGTRGEDDFCLHNHDGPGCPIADPDYAVDDFGCDADAEDGE